jgi:hypothetical protein
MLLRVALLPPNPALGDICDALASRACLLFRPDLIPAGLLNTSDILSDFR